MNTPKSTNDGAIYKAKQEWAERLVASKLPHATKSFGMAIFFHMYGTKIESWPGSATLVAASNTAKSKHPEHRVKLGSCGALRMRLVRGGDGDWENYVYTLNLNWDGNADPLEIEYVEKHELGCTPQGTTSNDSDGGGTQKVPGVVPTGNQGGTQKDVQVVPTGDTNTTIKTPTKTSSNTTNKEDAGLRPAVEELNLHETKEDEGTQVVDSLSLSEVSKTPASLDIKKEKAAAVDVEKKNAPPALMKKALESAREVNDEIASILDSAAVPAKAWEFYKSPDFRANDEDKRSRALWAQLESQDYVVRNWNDSDDLEDPDVEW